MVPVPGVLLGALARETSRIKIGPLVCLPTLTSPLKMIEEICILDHLSHGRLEVGVGRGASPFELDYRKIASDESRDLFIDAYKCILAGLAGGETFACEDVPLALKPLQKPYPAFWCGSSNETGSTSAGEQGMHVTANGTTRMAAENLATFEAAPLSAASARSSSPTPTPTPTALPGTPPSSTSPTSTDCATSPVTRISPTVCARRARCAPKVCSPTR